MSSFGSRVREARRRLGLTQRELADELCDRTYISFIERNKVSPSIDLAVQLAKRLHIDLADIAEEISESHSFQYLKIKSLIDMQEYLIAYELLEQYWWDAANSGNFIFMKKLTNLLMELFKNWSAPNSDWVEGMLLWLLDHNERTMAITLGATMQ